MNEQAHTPFHLSPEKRALLEALLAEETPVTLDAPPVPDAIPRRESTEFAPLSFGQERLWFLTQLEPESPAYNVALAYYLRGALDVNALALALTRLAHGHPVLRTVILADAGDGRLGPLQQVQPPSPVTLEQTDLQCLEARSAWDTAREWSLSFVRRTFDLAHGPVWRAGLVRMAPERHMLLLSFSHVIVDEWSVSILVHDLTRFYAEARTAGRNGRSPSANAASSVTYADYAAWQREQAIGARWEADLAYWLEQLAGAPQTLNLPLDRPRPERQSVNGAGCTRALSPALTATLDRLGRDEGTTLFTTLLAAFALLLQRYTGQSDLLVGCPSTGRNRPELQEMAGFFLNTLVMRCRVDQTENFRALLRRQRDTVLDAFDHQGLPFERLVEALRPARDLSRNPLFQVLFVFQQEGLPLPAFPDLTVTRFDLPRETAKFDLSLFASRQNTTANEGVAGGLHLYCEYNRDLFQERTIRQMLAHLETLLERVAAAPDSPLDSLDTLPPEERRRLVVTWNERWQQPAAYPGAPKAPTDLADLVARQAVATPHAPAISMGGRTLDYATLEEQAARLAHHLRARGVADGDVVALAMPRSPELLVALLAILKSGAAVLPLDAGYPHARLAFMLANSEARLLLGRSPAVNAAAEFPLPPFDGPIVWVDDLEGTAGPAPQPATTPVDPMARPAYLLYTSGSTGEPKGVVMPHGPLLNLLAWQTARSAAGPGIRTLQFTPLSFDVAFQEIFATLATGGELVMVDESVRRDPGRLLAFLAEQQIRRIFLPFIALQQLAATAAQRETPGLALHEVITAGEQLRITPQLRALFARLPGCTLDNQYGPTETHVVTAHRLDGDPDAWPELPPIGRPLPGVSIYVLDTAGHPAPTGVAGELYAGGICLAQGYRRRPGLTAARFIDNPLAEARTGDAPPRLYRTGDRARIRADGVLEFLGRADEQLKIRGYRVEPGEVEAVLARHPAVNQCAVVGRTDGGETRLVAYLTGAGEDAPAADALRAFMADLLPTYMIPTAFVTLDTLPLTPSGKVDRARLPAPEKVHLPVDTGYAPPRDETERRLAAIWEALLAVQPVGIHDDFFALGGHSLLAIRLFTAMEEAFGVRLPVATLFRAPTVAGLAAEIHTDHSLADWSTITPIQPRGTRSPLFLVHGFGGGVAGYAGLARLLDGNQPVYGLVAQGLDGHQPPDSTVEAMAARYVEAIRAMQPDGPYYLGGYCLGGVVAFEMARQLAAQGAAVGHLALLEAYAPAATGGLRSLIAPAAALNAARNLPIWLGDYLEQGLGLMWNDARRRAAVMVKNMGQRMGMGNGIAPRDIIGDDAEQVPAHIRRILELHLQAQIRYRPTPYLGPVTLYRVRRLSLLRSGDPLMGWARLAGGVTVRMIDGRHNNILEEPHVRSLAAALAADLDAWTAGSATG